MQELNVVFLGGLINPSLLSFLESENKYPIQYAAQAFQESILEGFKHNNIRIVAISAPFIGTYPLNSSLKITKFISYYHSGILMKNIQFNNVFPLYFFSKIRNILNELKNNNWTHIIIYSMYSPFLIAAYLYKKHINKNVKMTLIVPDLPEYMSSKKNIAYRLAKKLDRILINKCLSFVDSYVLLSDYMTEKLPIGKKPWVRVEGIYTDRCIDFEVEKTTKFTFLYTGTLDRRYNILDLMFAFMKIKDDNICLWICGKGNAESEIKKSSEIDSRIKYLGQLPREQILKMQKKATVLVNPRERFETFTKYSFPSKTMEYLASGTPAIMHQLPSIPEEYFKHLFFAEDGMRGLYAAMINVLSMSREKLNKKGHNARKFILEQKNSKVQVKKIISIL